MIETIGAWLTAVCILLGAGWSATRRRGGPVCTLFAFLFGLLVVAWAIFMFVWAAPAAMDFRQF